MSFSLIVSLFLVVLPLNVTTNTTGSGLKQNLQSEHQKQCDHLADRLQMQLERYFPIDIQERNYKHEIIRKASSVYNERL